MLIVKFSHILTVASPAPIAASDSESEVYVAPFNSKLIVLSLPKKFHNVAPTPGEGITVLL